MNINYLIIGNFKCILDVVFMGCLLFLVFFGDVKEDRGYIKELYFCG